MYAKYFNDKYEYIGHLFQARYFSNLITNVGELLEVSRYIHLNPVRANIAKIPEDYKWSSYNKILSNQNKELYIHDKEILDIFNMYLIIEDNRIERIRSRVKHSIEDNRFRYKNYVEEKIASEVNP